MAKKVKRTRPWTKDEVRMLKVLAREKTKTTVIAGKLKRLPCICGHQSWGWRWQEVERNGREGDLLMVRDQIIICD
jgi:hypothetical protein